HPALRDGDVHAHPLLARAGAQRGAARHPRARHAGAVLARRGGFRRRGHRGRAPARAAGGHGQERGRTGVSDSFLFYDLETWGIDPRRTRIAQFAAIRTDTELRQLGAPIEFMVRPADDLLPSPGASMVTGLAPQDTLQTGLGEAEAFARIVDEMARPGTCTLGYNSLRFDDEFVRHGLFRNFHDPYAREWRNGNCRWDLLDVMRLAHALRPEGIAWP